MTFCTNCGQQVADGAKFCANCGTPVSQNVSNTERKTVFDGEIHKCPNCGEVLKSFETACPACNFELRGAQSSSAVKDLAEKLERATSENQRIIIVKNFPVPNTKEDIFEFMLLASSNFDMSYYLAHINEEDLSDAWLAKIKLCYQKAKLSFSDTADFEKIQSIYDKITNSLESVQQQEQQKAIDKENRAAFLKSKMWIALVAPLSFLGIFLLMGFINSNILAIVFSILSIVSLGASFLFGIRYIKFKNKLMLILTMIIGYALFITAFSVSVSIQRPDYLKDNPNAVQISYDASDLKGMNYDDVKEVLENKGFTNIKLAPSKNLNVFGSLYEDGEVYEINIDGEDSFYKEQYFLKDSLIIIKYFSANE